MLVRKISVSMDRPSAVAATMQTFQHSAIFRGAESNMLMAHHRPGPPDEQRLHDGRGHRARSGMRSAQGGMVVNALLAIAKLAAGLIGNSYALVADAVESTADIFSSFIVWGGLRLASRDADDDYPFGYGKAEAISAATVSLMLLIAAVLIAVEAVREIMV